MNQKESSLTHYHLVSERRRGDIGRDGLNIIKGNDDLFNVVIVGIPAVVAKEDVGTLFVYLGIALSRTMSVKERIRKLEEDYDVRMTDGQESEVSIMCNLSEGIYEEGVKQGIISGRAEGRAEGKAEGRAEGKAEGKVEGREETAGNLLALNKLSIEEISIVTGLSVEDIDRIRVQMDK